MSDESKVPEVRTSRKEWVVEVAQKYKEQHHFILVDDAHLGIDPRTDTLFRMGQKADLSRNEWLAVIISLGVAVGGAWLVYMAVVDPEPYSKVAFAIGAGVVMVLGGGFKAIAILTRTKPPKVSGGPDGRFSIEW